MSDLEIQQFQSEPENSDERESGESQKINLNSYKKDGFKRPIKEKIRELSERVKEFFANPKKRLWFIIGFGVVVIAFFGLGFYFLTNENSSIVKNNDQTTADESTEALSAAPLDGVMAKQDAVNRHPLAVIVENHPDARPQAGLNKASIVYEAIAEGGITRFMALFGTNEAEKVGPVRSARTFFVDWARGFNAYMAHVGGNIDALDQIRAEKVLDLDQFGYSGPYWRERSAGIASEHTMYTSTPELRKQAETNKYTTANNFNVLKFKDDPTGAEKDALPASQKISVNFSNSQYNAVFDYDKTSNSYKRSLAGNPHVDQLSKEQITPKNLIVMTVDRKAVTTRINEAGYEMTTVGSGAAKIFFDGKITTGTWKKNSKTDREIFYDTSGQEIVFNRGQFWISVVPPEMNVIVE